MLAKYSMYSANNGNERLFSHKVIEVSVTVSRCKWSMFYRCALPKYRMHRATNGNGRLFSHKVKYP